MLSKGITFSFIILIPKVANPKSLQEFGPISLTNSLLKILLKVLTCRLEKATKNLVSETQSAFPNGKHSSESIIMVTEVIHSIQKRKVEAVLLKLDFSKAFDSVKWDFLIHSLSNFGFSR